MILQAERLNRWYGRVIALNDVSLSIAPGITGVLGPNGAGKSSFLRIAIGLMRASSGTIKVLGEDPWNNPSLAVRLGYCPEHDGFYETMTGRAFVTALARLRKAKNPRAAADEALERLKLTDVCHRKIGTYSRGMRQRLKIAQAIAHGPSLLILDEPLTGCDPIVRSELIAQIRSFPAEGRSVIVSSHVLHEVERLTSTIALIHHGRLVAEGDVHEIRALMDRHPHTVHVATGKPRDLASALAREPEVVEIRFDDDAVWVKTTKPETFYRRLPEIALAEKCPIRELSSPDDSMEAVFRYLTEK